MPVLAVEDDHVLRQVRVLLDPEADPERVAAYADYFRHDMPDLEGWKREMLAQAPGLYPSRVIDVAHKEALLATLPEADGAILEDLTLTEEDLQRAPKLRFVQSFGSQTRGIDAAACAKRGIKVFTLPRRVNIAVAEHAMALLFALAKRLNNVDGVVTTSRLLAAGFTSDPYDTRHTPNANWGRVGNLKMLHGSTLALIGLGEIGREMARLGTGNGMKVIYFQRHRMPEAEESKLNVIYAPFNDCLAQADFISLHVPKHVTDLIDAAAFARMKRGAILINTGRAPVINRAALIAALDSGQISAAGLDVLYEEPMQDGDTLLDRPNLMLTPHLAGASRLNGLTDMAGMFINIAKALK